MRAVGLALVAIAALWMGRPAPAEEPPPDPKLEASLRRTLEAEARKYANARATLRTLCGKCGGTGRYTELLPRGGHRTLDCPTCDTKGWRIARANWRLIFYEMKSPAYRLKPQAQSIVEDAYKRALASSSPPENYPSPKLAEIKLIDALHATTRITYGTKFEETVLWIRAEETAGRLEWFLYDQPTDGAWPVPDVPDAKPAEQAVGDPLPGELDSLLRATIGGIADRHHNLGAARQLGQSLYLTLDVKRVGPGVNLTDLALEDFRRLGRAIWINPNCTWADIRWTMRAKHRDKFGAIEQQPYLRAWITKEDFQRIRWNNLTPEEALALFKPDHPRHSDWILWNQD